MNRKELINRVSRSFALSLLSLPGNERDPVSLTYLAARLADTIVDSGSWSLDERLAHLTSWENAILQKKANLWSLKGSVGSFTESEAALLVDGMPILENLLALDPRHFANSQEVLQTLIEAMRWDLKTFGTGNASHPKMGVKDEALFDWYCYAIAGCVGRYWVRTFSLPENLELLAISYGKGLQRINILRDSVEDWKRGRVYLPTSLLERYQLNVAEEPWAQSGWPLLVKDYCRETHLLIGRGLNFCDSIPKNSWRVRWASLMPALIGAETLKRLNTTLDWKTRIKITRPEIRKLAILTGVRVILRRDFSQ